MDIATAGETFPQRARRALTSDRYLTLALIIGAVLAVHGLWWGWVETWDPDQMALRGLSLSPHNFLEPGEFLKPPFHTYLNFFLVVGPLRALEQVAQWVTGHPHHFRVPILYLARLIQLSMFLGTVWLSYFVTQKFTSRSGARCVALITATSAGFIWQTHLLTADIPVTFWLLASFAAAQSILTDNRIRPYLLAGALTGIATATKYNALAVGLAIPIFHYFAHRRESLLRIVLHPWLVIGVAMVVVSFVLANPYSVLDFKKFWADFMYNYITTPVYGGEDGGTGYVTFLLCIPEIIGWPFTVLIAACILAVLARIPRASWEERAAVTAALGVFLLYFAKFGAAPRVEVRFVLAVVPLLIVASGPAWSLLFERARQVAVPVLSLLLLYSVVCSYYVGKRFAEDPRMHAQAWVAAHVPPGSHMESSKYTPSWNAYPGIEVDDVRMPTVSGRGRLFAREFGEKSWVGQTAEARDANDAGDQWYRAEALAQRRPDFIALDNLYTDRYTVGGAGDLYPETHAFLTDLFAGKLGYHTVFDEAASGPPSPWVYPHEILILDNRITILARDGSQH